MPLERYNEIRLANESATIQRIARHREWLRPFREPNIDRPDIDAAERLANEYEDAAPPGMVDRKEECFLYDVEWPGYYGVTPSSIVPEEVRRLAGRYPTTSVAAYIPCDIPLSLREVLSYIHENRPESFSWGVPAGGVVGKSTISTAYHATRMNVPTTLLYKAYKSTLTLKTPSKTPGKRIGEYTIENIEVKSETDTAGRLMLQTYQPGYLLDSETLVATLARRTACVSRLSQYAEVQSYPLFNAWVGEAAELQNDHALAYTVGVLGDNPASSINTLYTCQENDTSCGGALSDTLHKIRMERWYP